MITLGCATFILFISLTRGQILSKSDKFPDGFLFGTATSAYQTEGAWNIDGKSENIWDHLTHYAPELIEDGTNGDVASDSYYHVDEDVSLLRDLNVHFYRFSLSWSRILPKGFGTEVNRYGLQYYHHLIDSLLRNGIVPVATLYHWDLPQILQDLGGWSNVNIVDYFTDYALVCFENFGPKVKYWVTFNEPHVICEAYGASNFAPYGVQADGIGIYLCSHHLLLAHASAYHLYNDTFKSSQGGLIGMSPSVNWFTPNSTLMEDTEATNRVLQFKIGIFYHPIYIGDYPEVVKTTIASRSAEEGFPNSRLPEFTASEIEFIRGTVDYLGCNYYTSRHVSAGPQVVSTSPSYSTDLNAIIEQEDSWIATELNWLRVTPWGFRETLIWLKNEYNNPAIYIMENGCPDKENFQDDMRIHYVKVHLNAVLEAIAEGVDVKMYTLWTLLDNFEWIHGYSIKFGLYHVNMSDPLRTRRPKASVEFYKQVIANNGLIFDDESTESTGSTFKVSIIILLVSIFEFNNFL